MTSSRTKDVDLCVVEVADGLIEDDALPRARVPEGVYAAQFIEHDTAMLFQHSRKRKPAPKLFLHFKLVELGPHLGVRLWRAYNVRELIGCPGRGGRFKVSRRSDLVRELAATVYQRRLRLDRISFADLRRVLVRVRVRTVEVNQRQKQIPAPLQYSIVDEIIGLEAGRIGE